MRRRRTCAATRLGALLLCGALAGCTKTLAFGTATKFALDVSQQADKNIDVSLGYDRAEIASIPAPKDTDATRTPDRTNGTDTYSVLGTFFVHYDNPFDSTDPLRLNQFFATGYAARAAAASTRFGQFFGHSASVIAAPPTNPKASITEALKKGVKK